MRLLGMKPTNEYEICIETDFLKILKKKPEVKKLFDRKIVLLKENLFHGSLNTKPINVSQQKLRQIGADAVYQFRLNMSFRCVFYVDETKQRITLVYVGNHEQVKKFYKK